MTAQTADFIRLDTTASPEGRSRVGARKVVLVPGDLVPILTLDLPAKLRGAVRETVARRQLGDLLGTTSSDTQMHPFFITGAEAEWRRALVVDTDLVAHWRRQVDPRARAVLPDYLALPTSPLLWTLSGTASTVLARLGPEDGFSAAPDLALKQLEQSLKDTGVPTPKAVLRLGAPLPEIETLLAQADIPVVTDPAALAALDITPPKILGYGELACDLRKDPQAARARLDQALRPLRAPLLFGALAAGLWAGSAVVTTRAMQDQTREVQTRTTAVVRADLVPQGPILDVRRQVSQALLARQPAPVETAEIPTAMDPLTLLSRTAQVLAAQAAVPVVVDMSDQNAGLRLELTQASFDAVEALQAAMATAGLQIILQEARLLEEQALVRAVFLVQP